MKKICSLTAVLLLLCGALLADAAPSTAFLHINGFKNLVTSGEVPQDSKPLQSVISINVFDNVSQRDNPLNPLSSSGEPVNVSVDKYLSNLYENPMSIATFKISGRVAPTCDRYYGDDKDPVFEVSMIDNTERYDITVEAGNEMVNTKNGNLKIPCVITVDMFKLSFGSVDMKEKKGDFTEGKLIGGGDTRWIKKEWSYEERSESMGFFKTPAVSGNQKFALTVELRNYTAYNTADGKAYYSNGIYTAGAGGQRIDHLSEEWIVEGRIMFSLAEGFTKAKYEALPAGTYRVPVTFKVTVQ